jgi:hypothetical protein
MRVANSMESAMSKASQQRTKSIHLLTTIPIAIAALIQILCCFLASSSCGAQDARMIDDFVWQKDKLTGVERAASLGESSLGFFDVGDLSYYSLYLVRQTLGSLADATGEKIDTSMKRSTIAIFHDTKVFSRLKSDRQSFTALGIPDDTLDRMQQRVKEDAKCIYETRSDDTSNVFLTVILLSENFNECLIHGLINSFGIRAADVNIKTLIDACVLYEGRRLGLRDRQALSLEASKLRDICFAKAGEIK